MAKKVRKKTKAELAAPAFRKRATSQSEVLMHSLSFCDKLSKSRKQYILDAAADEWVSRFKDRDDDEALDKESRRWKKLRKELVECIEKPLEIHCFTCHYNASYGMKPLLKMVKHPACDAGTALRLFWINDPVYYSQYATISECSYEDEKGALRMLRAIERRFRKADFKTKKIAFDPQPWLEADDVDLEALNLPESMLVAIP